MTKAKVMLVLAGVGLIVAMAIAGQMAKEADEEKVSLDQVPPAVRATILKAAEGGTIKEIERESRNGKTIYEAEIVRNGKETEIKVAEDGTLLGTKVEEEDEEEDELSLEQVPDAAREAILRAAKGAKIEEVERETENGLTLYEAEWRINGRKCAVEVTADGTVVELEESVNIKAVPAAVRRAAESAFGKTAGLKAEKKTITLYELEGRIGQKKREVLISPTGKVLPNALDD